MTQAAFTRLQRVRTNLILAQPFFGTLALNMEMSIHPPEYFDEDNPTARVSPERMEFCDQFIDSLTDDELMFVMAHEVMHPALGHNYTIKQYPELWNQACDYVVNQLLVDSKVGRMPKIGLYDPAIYKAGGETSDGIYTLLARREKDKGGDKNKGQPQPQSGQGKPQSGQGKPQPGQGKPQPQPGQETGQGKKAMDTIAPSSNSAGEQESKVRLIQAAKAAKMAGKLPAGFERLVEDTLRPIVDWAALLHDFMHKARTSERSFSRPNRRFLMQDLYLPSISGERLGPVVVAVDCSGSISDTQVNRFSTEIRSLFEELLPEKLHVLYFDTKVHRHDTFESGDTVNIRPKGGGGTRFSPVFRYIENTGTEPVAVVFLSDMECRDFGTAPSYPVLWVSTEKKSYAPFGEITYMADVEA